LGLEFFDATCRRTGRAIAAVLGRPTAAQSCKDLPPEPAKKQCVMQNHPAAFENKKARCRQLAERRGSAGKGGGQKDFMQGCMQGKVSP